MALEVCLAVKSGEDLPPSPSEVEETHSRLLLLKPVGYNSSAFPWSQGCFPPPLGRWWSTAVTELLAKPPVEGAPLRRPSHRETAQFVALISMWTWRRPPTHLRLWLHSQLGAHFEEQLNTLFNYSDHSLTGWWTWTFWGFQDGWVGPQTSALQFYSKPRRQWLSKQDQLKHEIWYKYDINLKYSSYKSVIYTQWRWSKR